MRTIGGRYELRGELASGGMATVHLARQLGAAGFARIVAVKRLHERFARDPEFVAMFLDEARLVGRIRHPNVVQTLDVVQEKAEGGGSELFIVMEYVHGDSLVRLLSATRKAAETVPLKIASAIMVGVLHGLHEAHEATSETGEPLGIVHRDVSPHNVLVGIDGVSRVLDFGVAKAEERMSSTSDGKVKGKLSYMAPEQVSGETDIDRRTDVYAAAIVCWEILAGEKLFQGPNDAATIQRVVDANVAAPSTHNSQVPASLDAVILRGLAKDRSRRHATASELAQAIAEAVPPATVNEVGAWVRRTAQEDLELKTKLIAAIEARGIAKSKSEAAKSLEAVGKTQIAADAPTSPTRAAIVRPPSAPSIPPPSVQKTMLLPANFKPPATPPELKATQPLPDPNTGTRTAAVVTSAATVSARKSTPMFPILAALGMLVISGAIFAVVWMERRLKPVDVATPASASDVVIVPPPASCPVGMVRADAGQFFMGSDDNSSAEKPAHKVMMHAFCIDRREVTQADYKKCSDNGSCRRPAREVAIDDLPPKQKKLFDSLCNMNDETHALHPANCVDWDHAKQYCEARDARLPTEAEWEYAARGPEQRMYAWGEPAPDAQRLNGCGQECVKWLKGHGEMSAAPLYAADDGWPTTSPVGSFPAGASRIGAEDLQGNVWEWVADFYALYEKGAATNPMGPESGRDRIIRGGAWDSTGAEWLRATYRSPRLPSTRSHLIGFRCAKTL